MHPEHPGGFLHLFSQCGLGESIGRIDQYGNACGPRDKLMMGIWYPPLYKAL
jgi:hypothetical protein